MMQNAFVILSLFCEVARGVKPFRIPGAGDLQGELNEAEGNGLAAGLQGASADCASATNEVGAKEGPVVNSLKESAKKMAASHRSSAEDQEDDKAIEEAMNGPCGFGAVDAPPEPLPAMPSCVPDYSALCPKGWEVEGGSLCRASEEYEGDCDVMQDLGGFVLEQKRAFERICKVSFPCQIGCEKNYLSCPNAWQEVAPGVCLAPESYVACDPRLEVSGMTTQDKILFETVCAVSWPCMPPSLHDYSDVCPAGWILKAGNACEAPDAYNGPCGKIAENMLLDLRSKKDFETRCSVSWPSHSACSRDYRQECPAGWLAVDGECQAPSSYSGNCQKITSFADYSPMEKENWALSCEAPWACHES